MNENAKMWVAALRSGKYEQGGGYLCTNNKFCCLGVACDLYYGNDYKEKYGQRYYGNNVAMLPINVQDWLGLNSRVGSINAGASLAMLNDGRRTFDQIADVIESEPDGLFK